MDKLQYIINEINTVKNYNKHIKNAKRLKIVFYRGNLLKLDKIPKETILKHSFASEVLSLGEMLEKKDIISKIIMTKKIKLETHAYAPELNKLIIIGKSTNVISAPNVVHIEKDVSVTDNLINPSAINLATFLSKASIPYLKNILILN